MPSPGYRVKKAFFAPKELIALVGKATAVALQGGAAIVMRSARQSIRKSKKPAAAGQPPRSHKGLLRRLIKFAFDRSSRSMLVGPEKANAAAWDEPAALEAGGVSLLRKARRGKHGEKVHQIRVAPHPYMGPALKKEESKLPPLWADAVKP